MKTIASRNPHRLSIVRALGFPSGKLPALFTFDGYIELFSDCLNRHSMGTYHIVVTETKPTGRTYSRWNIAKGCMITKPVKSSTHRIFAKFGSRLVPVGRLAQAKDTAQGLAAVPCGC